MQGHGEQIESETVEKGSKLIEPATPMAKGYTTMIIEGYRTLSEDRKLELLVANDVKIYKGIYCFGGYSKVYDYGTEKNSTRTRNVYANGVVSEVMK